MQLAGLLKDRNDKRASLEDMQEAIIKGAFGKLRHKLLRA
jgi:hypothetical protein